MSGIIGRTGSKSGFIGTTELDYEEGTWIPTMSEGSITVSDAVYTKVGRLVMIRAYVYGGNVSNGNGWRVEGLPFPPVKESVGSGNFYHVDDWDAGMVMPRATTSGTGGVECTISRDDTTWLTLNYAAVNDGTAGHVHFNITYMATS